MDIIFRKKMNIKPARAPPRDRDTVRDMSGACRPLPRTSLLWIARIISPLPKLPPFVKCKYSLYSYDITLYIRMYCWVEYTASYVTQVTAELLLLSVKLEAIHISSKSVIKIRHVDMLQYLLFTVRLVVSV